MSEHDSKRTEIKLFGRTDIRAISDNHALLMNNEAPIIGYIKNKKRFEGDGKVVALTEVCFHYDTEHSDFFYFEDMKMVYQAISIETLQYLTEKYKECILQEKISPEKFIEELVDTYVFTKLGF